MSKVEQTPTQTPTQLNSGIDVNDPDNRWNATPFPRGQNIFAEVQDTIQVLINKHKLKELQLFDRSGYVATISADGAVKGNMIVGRQQDPHQYLGSIQNLHYRDTDGKLRPVTEEMRAALGWQQVANRNNEVEVGG